MKKLTLHEFIEKSIKIHGYKYDYSLVNYINNITNVKIICKKCQVVFEQSPATHFRGCGCPNHIKLSQQDFINRSNKIHDFYYDYSLVNYINNDIKVKIICDKHGSFEQRPDGHLKGIGCKKCADEKLIKTTEYFIQKSIERHGYFYDYSKVKYINSHSKVIIICPDHGQFTQLAYNHLSGYGCQKCNSSFKEKQIMRFFKEHNISYIYQKTFNNCRGIKNKLPFDFYLTDYNICIEYDGEQHFEDIKYFGGIDFLEKCKIRDQIKTDYCKNNNIELIRIKYDEDLISKLNELYITFNSSSNIFI